MNECCLRVLYVTVGYAWDGAGGGGYDGVFKSTDRGDTWTQVGFAGQVMEAD